MNKNIIPYIILTLLFATVATATDINTCTDISSSGDYNLIQDLYGNISITHGTSTYHGCIGIGASNININCQNHKIDILNYQSKSNGGAIVIKPSTVGAQISNVTIQNCIIVTSEAGIIVPYEIGYATTVLNNFRLINNVFRPTNYLTLATTNSTSLSSIINVNGSGVYLHPYSRIENSTINYNTFEYLNYSFDATLINYTQFYNNIFVGNKKVFSGGANIKDNLIYQNQFSGPTIDQWCILGVCLHYAYTGFENFESSIGENTWNGAGSYGSLTGNYWHDVTGYNGSYSDYCTDADVNMVCDDSYTFYSNEDLKPIRSLLGTGYVSPANYPGINLTFLGVDQTSSNFVFTTTINAINNGTQYYASKNRFIGVTNGTENYNINWFSTGSTDLVSFFEYDGCPSKQAISGSFFPINKYYPSLSVNYTANGSSCYTGIQINITPLDFNNGGTATINMPIFQDFPLISGTEDIIGSFELFGGNVGAGQLIFHFNQTSKKFRVDYYDGETETTELSNITYNRAEIIIRADISFELATVIYTITSYNNMSVAQTNSFTVDIARPLTSIDNIHLNDYITSDIERLGVSSIEISKTDTPGSTTNTLYIFLGISGAGSSQTKIIYEPATRYGRYEETVYATDDTHGIYDYNNYKTIQYTYTNETKILTNEEINAILNDQLYANAGNNNINFGSDVATEILPYALNMIGIKSAGSRFLVGLLVIAACVALGGMAGLVGGPLAGVFGAIIMGLISPVLCVYLGLWPAWVVAVLVIVAALAIAAFFRRTVVGN